MNLGADRPPNRTDPWHRTDPWRGKARWKRGPEESDELAQTAGRALFALLALAGCAQGQAGAQYAPYAPENNGNMHDGGGGEEVVGVAVACSWRSEDGVIPSGPER
jgi:hypothetical protein